MARRKHTVSRLYFYEKYRALILNYMKQAHLDKLTELLDSALTAHQTAKWGSAIARKMITKSIVKRFKSYLELYENKLK